MNKFKYMNSDSHHWRMPLVPTLLESWPWVQSNELVCDQNDMIHNWKLQVTVAVSLYLHMKKKKTKSRFGKSSGSLDKFVKLHSTIW